MNTTVRYIRVSTVDQNTARQEKGDHKYYIDKCSGRIPFAERPEGSKLLRDANAGKFTNVVIDSIDRLGRNTKDILDTIDQFTSLGICIESEREQLKTCDPDGNITPIANLVINLMASIAQLDVDLKREAQLAGIAARKEAGKYVSHRKGVKETDEQIIAKPVNQKILRHLQKNNGRVNLASRDIRYKNKKGKWQNVSTKTVTKIKNIAIEKGLLELKTAEQINEEKLKSAFGSGV